MTDNQATYSKADLERAAAAIKRMTPEDYLQNEDYIHNLERNWPEVPCSANLKVVYENGYNVQWTLRDFDEDMLAVRLANLFEALDREGAVPADKYDRYPLPTGETPASGSGSAPATPEEAAKMIITTPGVTVESIVAGGYEIFPVETIIHEVSRGQGVHHLVVMGGNWTQFGWKAWPEALPAGFDINTYEIGHKMSPPPSMKMAYFDKGKKKVVAFQGLPPQ